MPELPEVETVMRAMQARLEGQTIVAVDVRRPDLRRPFPANLARRLKGQRIDSFRRRGKYILMRLSGGESLLLHLGMSGRVMLAESGGTAEVDAPVKHEHLMFRTREGVRFGLIDPRRFGMVDLVSTHKEDEHSLLASMGPEPLEAGFSTATLGKALAGRNSPIKTLLLDQKIVSGLGNIYVCEALYRAGIHPQCHGGDLKSGELKRLVSAIRNVLRDAVAAGGSSLKDYAQPDGQLGYFQHSWQVYGRAGRPCPDCSGDIGCPGVQSIVMAGRSTFFCPKRQKADSA